ncbi:MAG TPA: epoxyqueuosine reductase QueH [bacterium]|nr:epoxyqueuosine reductase QueH [bacterium]
MKKFLLHACCAPCSIYVLDKLRPEHDLVVFFYNPNIQPRAEYEQRKEELKKYCQKIGIDFIDADYDYQKWFALTDKHKTCPEKGERCSICFQERLSVSGEYAKNHGFDLWGTTLTISPHKNADLINQIGRGVGERVGVPFYEADWKKADGFKIATQMSKDEGFYRQDYCGCVYSWQERNRKTNNL